MEQLYGTRIGPPPYGYARVLDVPWETWKALVPTNTWLKAGAMVTMSNPEDGAPLVPAVVFTKPRWYEHPRVIGIGIGLVAGGLTGFLLARRSRRR